MAEPESVTLAEFDRNATEKVRIRRTQLGGKDLVDVRVFWENSSGQWLPGKQGICVRIDKLPDLIEALEEAQEVINKEEG